MTPDELQQQEDLGRKIAAALAPLGLSREEVQAAAHDSGCAVTNAEDGIPPTTAAIAKRMAAEFTHCGWAREAGAAAYFEEQGK